MEFHAEPLEYPFFLLEKRKRRGYAPLIRMNDSAGGKEQAVVYIILDELMWYIASSDRSLAKSLLYHRTDKGQIWHIFEAWEPVVTDHADDLLLELGHPFWVMNHGQHERHHPSCRGATSCLEHCSSDEGAFVCRQAKLFLFLEERLLPAVRRGAFLHLLPYILDKGPE